MADGDKDVDGRYVKSTVSLSKKKMSKVLQSRVSLKKFSSNSQMSYASEASFVMKRQSDFDRSSSKVPRYQNSYRLDPQKPFNTCLVYREIAAVIDGLSLTQPYDDMLMMKMANSIAMDVRARVKTLSFDRCKLCVLVFVGENKLQGVQAAFRALWDVDRDSWVSYSFQSRNFFITCTCFGVKTTPGSNFLRFFLVGLAQMVIIRSRHARRAWSAIGSSHFRRRSRMPITKSGGEIKDWVIKNKGNASAAAETDTTQLQPRKPKHFID